MVLHVRIVHAPDHCCTVVFWVGACGIAFDRKFISGAALLCGVAPGAMQIRFGCGRGISKFKCHVAYKIWILEINFG